MNRTHDAAAPRLFASGGWAARAERVFAILDLFGDRDACALHAERAALAEGAVEAGRLHGHARALLRLRESAEAQSACDRPCLHEILAANASSLEEALAVLSAAVREGVAYEDGAPDWRRSFISTLPQDGSFREARPSAEASPLPPAGASMPLSGGLSLRACGRGHWVVRGEEVLCGPGRTALRITPPEHAGRSYGALHCAAERLLNFGDPRSQPCLTIGGYKSRSRAWDLQADEARSLGLPVHDKGEVPDFEDLALTLSASDDAPEP